jgi:hypothetical protein
LVGRENPEAATATKATDYPALIKSLKESPNRFARWVANKAENIVGMKIDPTELPASGGAAGKFGYAARRGSPVRFPDYRKLSFRADQRGNETTLTHELVHGIAAEILDNPNPSQKPIVKSLEDLYAAIKDNPVFQGPRGTKDYGTESVHEFVSEGLSNPEFQLKLIGIPYKNTTAWSRFTQLVGNLLGIRPEDRSAFTELINLTDQLSQEKAVEESVVSAIYRPSKDEAEETTRELTDKFKRWFGDSKVVDKNGEPLVIYRGLNTNNESALNAEAAKGYAAFGSDSPAVANTYANPDEVFGGNGSVMPLDIKADKLIEFPVKY